MVIIFSRRKDINFQLVFVVGTICFMKNIYCKDVFGRVSFFGIFKI